MATRSTHHATFKLERTYEAPASRVFAAWADVDARQRWAVPDGDAIEFLASDFRVGGRDLSRCGPIGNLSYHIETTYQNIVDGERLVMTETVDHEGARLEVALLTVEFRAAGARTNLALTVQIAGLDSPEMVEGSREGWNAVLDKLAVELEATPATA